ncbi:hypothetical protein [Bifidobacterium moukalabense]|uniref:hypothetical protein n=1 Tax=Bifidobacterium moukalabense TaxID=1333651 RepID=UPI0010F8857A|nr:hypothetical protein [Bifidobacterium moukalabense]
MYQLKYVDVSRSCFPLLARPRYVLQLETADGITHSCESENMMDKEAEAWLIHSCGLEGSQVEIIR